MRVATSLALMTAFILLSACGSMGKKSRPGYGLPVMELEISPENLSRLNGTTAGKIPVGSTVLWQGRRYPARVHYSGKSTLFHYKRSWQITFTAESPFGRRQLRLSSQAFDPSGLRSLLGFTIFRRLGPDTPAIEPVTFYLNGEFKGLYFRIEYVDEEFIRARGSTPGNLYKARYGRLGYATLRPETVNHLNEGFTVKRGPGTFSDLRYLIRLLAAPADAASRAAIEDILDTDNFRQYLVAAFLMNHWDGYINNFYLHRPPGGRFRVIPWDLDKIYQAGIPLSRTTGLAGTNAMTQRLMADATWSASYGQLLQEHLDIYLRGGELTAILEEETERIARAWLADPVFSASGTSPEEERDRLLQIAQQWLVALPGPDPQNPR